MFELVRSSGSLEILTVSASLAGGTCFDPLRAGIKLLLVVFFVKGFLAGAALAAACFLIGLGGIPADEGLRAVVSSCRFWRVFVLLVGCSSWSMVVIGARFWSQALIDRCDLSLSTFFSLGGID